MSDATTFPGRAAVPDSPYLPVTTACASAGPVQPHQRIQLLDVLRGFALLGILQANWQHVSGDLYTVVDFLIEGSFYTMFSFLFGLGFSIQLIRAEEAKRPFILRYLWRTLILGVIGAIHMVFIYAGDILLYYALLAGLLLFVRRWRPSLILAFAAAILVFSMSPPAPAGHFWTRVNPEQVEAERLRTQLSDATDHPRNYPQYVRDEARKVERLLTHFVASAQGGRNRQGATLFMFLLGLYVGRRRILRDPAQHTRFLAWTAGVALVVGVAGSSLDIFADFFAGKGIVLPKGLDGWRLAKSFGNIGLSLFYLAGIALVFTHWRLARRALSPLANVGRLGLTNYLMQSVILGTVLGWGFGLTAYGLGLVGGIRGWYSLLLINAVFVVQILYSQWWFRHFQFGPVEWAWRSLTWFRAQPFRLKSAA